MRCFELMARPIPLRGDGLLSCGQYKVADVRNESLWKVLNSDAQRPFHAVQSRLQIPSAAYFNQQAR